MLLDRSMQVSPPSRPARTPPSCIVHGDCVMVRAAASCFGDLRAAGPGGRVRDSGPSPLTRCHQAEAGLCPPGKSTP